MLGEEYSKEDEIMSMDWKVYYEDETGSMQFLDYLPRPNDNLPIVDNSNLILTKLADGSDAVYMNENKKSFDILNFVWKYQSYEFVNKLRTWQQMSYKLLIETHVSGEEYKGFIKSVNVTWLTGIEPDTFHVEVQFLRINT